MKDINPMKQQIARKTAVHPLFPWPTMTLEILGMMVLYFLLGLAGVPRNVNIFITGVASVIVVGASLALTYNFSLSWLGGLLSASAHKANGASTLATIGAPFSVQVRGRGNEPFRVLAIQYDADAKSTTYLVARQNGQPMWVKEDEVEATQLQLTVNEPPILFNQYGGTNSITVSSKPIHVNTSLTASGTFTDIDSDTHTAIWDWGDRTTSSGTVTESNGSGSVSDSHTYIAAGVYTITLTVTNSGGQSVAATYQYLSVYNPTPQGLFSAGQKYTSPACSYPQNPSLTGDVLFGLVGDRQFTMKFKAANLTFNATPLTTPVISNGIGTLTGTGTLNGSGTYNFLVTGSESANTIRIQITDSSGNVVYDTQPGAQGTATPTTSVTAGSVLAH